jgi:hypothetical protein
MRDASLDALRGLAVLGMVLSGAVGFGGQLPAWMYHAQLPPPLHKLQALPGITWVDLVFPMFLFALGAALPLALQKAGARGLLWTALRRGALLLYFALFTQHFKAWNLAAQPGPLEQCMSIAAFALLGLQLVRRTPTWLRLAAWVLALTLLFTLPFKGDAGFDPKRQDIILMVLANMALLGSLLWGLTRQQPWIRWALLPAIVAVMLAPTGSWTHSLLQWSPLPWAHQFVFLKYLLIVVPGMVVGEWLLQGPETQGSRGLAGLALALVLVNVTLLFARETSLNVLLSAALLAFGAVRAQGAFERKVWQLGATLLLLGLLLEPLQGGIRKDPSTFSYQVLGAALSIFMLLALRGLHTQVQAPLAGIGRNPLLAYVAGSLLVLPLLQLTGLMDDWSALNSSGFTALLKGLLFTAAVAGITLLANRLGWVWRS